MICACTARKRSHCLAFFAMWQGSVGGSAASSRTTSFRDMLAARLASAIQPSTFTATRATLTTTSNQRRYSGSGFTSLYQPKSVRALM